MLHECIRYYNEVRIKLRLKNLSPMKHRAQYLSYLSAQFFGNTFWAGKKGYFTLVILLAVFKRHNW